MLTATQYKGAGLSTANCQRPHSCCIGRTTAAGSMKGWPGCHSGENLTGAASLQQHCAVHAGPAGATLTGLWTHRLLDQVCLPCPCRTSRIQTLCRKPSAPAHWRTQPLPLRTCQGWRQCPGTTPPVHGVAAPFSTAPRCASSWLAAASLLQCASVNIPRAAGRQAAIAAA